MAKIELDELVKKIRSLIFDEIECLHDHCFNHVKKYIRDSYAFDFMEGTHVIQKNNLMSSLKQTNYVANW